MNVKRKIFIILGSILLGIAFIVGFRIVPYFFRNVNYECEHVYKLERKNSTCTENGYERMVCEKCGKSESKKVLEKGHKNIKSTEYIYPTCSEPGQTSGMICEDCGKWIIEPKMISVIPHKYNSSIIPSTCTERGYTLYTCKVCSASYSDNYQPTLEHDLSYEVVKKSSCSEQGLMEATCTICLDTFTKIIEKTDHQPSLRYVDDFCNNNPIGEIYCVDCDELISMFGHHYSVEYVSPTCTEFGKEIYECSICGDSYQKTIAPIGHIKGEEVVHESTCKEKGCIEVLCLNCDEVISEIELELVNHEYSSIMYGTSIFYTCNYCSYTYQVVNDDENYNVYFVTNCDYILNPIVVKYGEKAELVELEKEGYTFIGWYIDSDLEIPYIDQCIYEDTTLYARFEKEYITGETNDNLVSVNVPKNFTFNVITTTGESSVKSNITISDTSGKEYEFNYQKIGSNKYKISPLGLKNGCVYTVVVSNNIEIENNKTDKFVFMVESDTHNNTIYKDDVYQLSEHLLIAKENYGDKTLVVLDMKGLEVNSKFILFSSEEMLLGMYKIDEVVEDENNGVYICSAPQYDEIFDKLDIAIADGIEISEFTLPRHIEEEMIETFKLSSANEVLIKSFRAFATETNDGKFKYKDIKYDPIAEKINNSTIKIGIKITAEFENDEEGYIKIVVNLTDTLIVKGSVNIDGFDANLNLTIDNSFTMGVFVLKGYSYSSTEDVDEISIRKFKKIFDKIEEEGLETIGKSDVKDNQEKTLYSLPISIYGIPAYIDLHSGIDWDVFGQFGIEGVINSRFDILVYGSLFEGFDVEYNTKSSYSITATLAGKIEIHPYIGVGLSVGIDNVLAVGASVDIGPYVFASGLANVTYLDGEELDVSTGWYLECGIKREIDFRFEFIGSELTKNISTGKQVIGSLGTKDILLYVLEHSKEQELWIEYDQEINLDDYIINKIVKQNLETFEIFTEDVECKYVLKEIVQGRRNYLIIGNNTLKILPNPETQIILKFYVVAADTCYEQTLTFNIKHTHEYTVIDSKEPNCTTDGYYTYTCNCGLRYTDFIEAPGHDYVDGKCNTCGYCSEEFTAGLRFSKTSGGYSVLLYEGKSDTVIIPSIYQGEPVISINSTAFAYGSSSHVTSISIPNTITDISRYTFSYLSYLKYNIYEGYKYLGNEQNPYYILCGKVDSEQTVCIINPNCQVILDGSLQYVEKIIVPDSMISIKERQFYNLRDLKFVVLPNTLEEIGTSAFEGCSSLTDISFPDTLRKIDDRAFYGCSSLKSVLLPSGIEIIGAEAFYKCTSVVNVYLPSSLKEIGSYAFCSCSNIETLIFEENSQIDGINEGVFRWCSNINNIELPNNITYIDNEAFRGCLKLISIEIPDQVTRIGKNAFESCTELKTVKLPAKLEILEYKAFSSCEKLTDIVIPNSVTKIGDYAFAYCYQLQNIKLSSKLVSIGEGALGYCTSLESVRIPDSVTTIGRMLFYESTSLKDVTLSNNLTIISGGMFYNCTGLTSITIPDSVNELDDRAFYGCSNLVTLTIPSNVNKINSELFTGCDSLCSVYFDGTIEDWCNIDFSYYSSSPLSCVKNVYIKNEYSQYYNVSELEDLILPNTIATIKESTFAYFNINSITIPNTVTNIERFAFYNCLNLTSVNFEDNSELEIIGNECFFNCSNLQNIVFPDSVIQIGYLSFKGCEKLKYNVYDNAKYLSSKSNQYFALLESIDDSITECDINEQTKIIISEAFKKCVNLREIEIPYSVINIGYEAFSECYGLRYIYLHDNIRMIDSFAFEYCESIKIYCEPETKPEEWSDSWFTYSGANIYWGVTKDNFIEQKGIHYILDLITDQAKVVNYVGNDDNVTISNTVSLNGKIYKVTSIGEASFKNCEWLSSIEFFDNIKIIKEYAFEECTNLKDIYMPNSVENISYGVFYNCTSLENVYFAGTIEDWCNIEFNTYDSTPMCYASHFYIKNNANRYIEVTKLVIPDSVTYLNNYQFYGFSNVTEVIIPNSVQKIGQDVLSKASSLKILSIPYTGDTLENSSQTRLGYLFGGGWPSYNGDSVPESLRKVIITDGTAIKDNAFEECTNLVEIVISNSNIISLGRRAFYKCQSLIDITLPNGLTSIGDEAFMSCSSLTKVIIPDTVNTIGYSVFASCTSLTSVNIPENITTISDSMFSNTAIVNFEVPKHITKIGDSAFSACSMLENVEFSGNVETIGNYAFASCDNLKNIVLPKGLVEIGNSVFNNCTYLETVYIPNTVKIIGESAFYLCTYLKKVEIEKNSQLTEIKKYAFSYCDNLESIKISNSVSIIGESVFNKCYSLTIYCEAPSEPREWHYRWNSYNCPVVWGANMDE